MSEHGFWCTECDNTGTILCLCGGDFCACGEEELECPACAAGWANAPEIEDDGSFANP